MGYVSLAIVIIGVAGEAIHDFAKWFKATWWGPNGTRVSVLVLIIGLAAEGVTQFKSNSTSGQIIAFLNERAATLEKEAALARLETQNLKKQLAWREVTPQRADIIRRALQSTPMQITISWVAGDPEGSTFSRQLAEALARSGMEISAFAPMGFLGQEPHGLSISGSERNEVEALASALAEAGFGRPSVEINSRKPDGTKYFTHLQVGYRAPPTLNP